MESDKKRMPNKKQTKKLVTTIDARPSWSSCLPAILGVLENPDVPEAAKEAARSELKRALSCLDNLIKIYAKGPVTFGPRRP